MKNEWCSEKKLPELASGMGTYGQDLRTNEVVEKSLARLGGGRFSISVV